MYGDVRGKSEGGENTSRRRLNSLFLVVLFPLCSPPLPPPTIYNIIYNKNNAIL